MSKHPSWWKMLWISSARVHVDDLKSTRTIHVWTVFRINHYSGVFRYDENANFTMNSIEFSGHIIKNVYRRNLINPKDEISFSNQNPYLLTECWNNIVISVPLSIWIMSILVFDRTNLKFVTMEYDGQQQQSRWNALCFYPCDIIMYTYTQIVIYIIRSNEWSEWTNEHEAKTTILPNSRIIISSHWCWDFRSQVGVFFFAFQNESP